MTAQFKEALAAVGVTLLFAISVVAWLLAIGMLVIGAPGELTAVAGVTSTLCLVAGIALLVHVSEQGALTARRQREREGRQ